ncbi:MAG: DUF559 domain-containing protein [Nocardioidaceae bacterium]
MDVRWTIYRLGGVSDRRTLVDLTSRKAVDRALRDGVIVQDARGRYAVPAAGDARRAAHAIAGVVSHRSAALYWGWQVKTVPGRPDVTVPRNRNVPAAVREQITPHWAALPEDEVQDGVTSMRRTMVDCLRGLAFDEALAIAGSALRNGNLSHQQLLALADGVSGAGARQCRRVAAAADPKAANPFESVLRALTLEVPGLVFEPQVTVTSNPVSLTPDLVDRERRIALEADSFSWHGSRGALRRDCRRYNALVLLGWWVLRFTWEDVMHDPEYVRDCLAVLVVPERAELPEGGVGPA